MNQISTTAMNPNIYEMEGSPQMMLKSTHEPGESTLLDMYSSGDARGHFQGYHLPSSQLDLDLLHDLTQSPKSQPLSAGPRPRYRSGTTPVYGPDPSCLFRSEILDDCAKARFYAGMLELYLLDNEHQIDSVGCPMASCPAQDFKHPKDMLRHLKNCKSFEKGKFWCPTCQRFESFKVRSGKQCSWDKEHNIGRKILQKSKDVFRGFGATRSATQQPPNRGGICDICSSLLPTSPMRKSHTDSLCQLSPTQLAGQPPTCHQAESRMPINQRHELDATTFSELCAVSSSSNSSTQLSDESPMMPPVYHQDLRETMSEISLVSASPHQSSFSISPTSSTRVDPPLVGLPHGLGGIPNLTHGHEISPGFTQSNLGFSQQSTTALDANSMPSHGDFGPLIPSPVACCSSIPGQFATSSTLPLTLGRTIVHHEVPIVRAQTQIQPRRRRLGLVAHLPDLDMSLSSSHTLDSHFRVAAASSPPSIGDPFATQDSSPVSASAPPLATPAPSTESPTLPSAPETELRCGECDYRPTGKLHARKAYLRKHEDTHKKNPRIPCAHCEQTFTRRDNLGTHLKRTHTIFDRPPSKRRRASSDSLQALFSGPKKKGTCSKSSERK